MKKRMKIDKKRSKNILPIMVRLLCDACGAGKTNIVESLYKKGADFIGALRDHRIFDDTKHHQKILLYQKQFVGESTLDLSKTSVRKGQCSGLPKP